MLKVKQKNQLKVFSSQVELKKARFQNPLMNGVKQKKAKEDEAIDFSDTTLGIYCKVDLKIFNYSRLCKNSLVSSNKSKLLGINQC